MKAVIYARVSTEQQDTERQVKELQKVAESEGYTDVKFFEDKVSGATKAKTRKQFDAMLSYIEENNINQIYCWELSRLGRSMIDNYTIIQELRNKGINIFIFQSNINTNKNDKNSELQLNLLSSIAEYERKSIKERTKSGTYNSIKKGGVGGGSIKQYGYKKENGKLVIDEEEKAVILDIVDKYLVNDWSVLQIANYLNNLGVKTRIKKLVETETINYNRPAKLLWTDGSVARLLHKKLLIGFRVYGEVAQQDENLRILSDETFEALQIKMAGKRKDNANAQKFENIFRGLIKCGNCGSVMVMHKGTSGLMHHYKCNNKFTLKGKCNSAMIDIDLLNNKVFNVTKRFKVDSGDIAERINTLESFVKANSILVNQLNSDLRGLKNKESFLVDMLSNNQIDIEIYTEKRKAIKEEAETLKEKIIKLESQNTKSEFEIGELSKSKQIDLENTVLFKANIKNLIESITVNTLSNEDLVNIPARDNFNDIIRKFTRNVGAEMRRMNESEKNVFTDLIDAMKTKINNRNKVYEVIIKMIDNKTTYNPIFNNTKVNSEYAITID